MKDIPASPLHRYYEAHQRDLDDAYRHVMDRGEFILGQEVGLFEHEFAGYCGTHHCVGVGNGLDALKLILVALGVKAGDEVIVPGNTFIATFLAVTEAGGVPVPVDPRPDTFTIDPTNIENALTERTRAIILVHLFGQPADVAPIVDIATAHGLKLVEDAAQAHGAAYRGQRVGGLADAAAFSFYPIKNLGGFGDGGAVTTQDHALAEAVARLRNYGSSNKYQHDVIGFNSRLDELQAAFLRVGLKSLDQSNSARTRLAKRYDEALADCAPTLTVPRTHPDARSVWHQYVVLCDDRDALQEFLAARSIPTLIHYPIPPHLQPAYARVDPPTLRSASLPITERHARTSLSLPIHPYLTEAEQTHVIETVLEFCHGNAGGTARRNTGKAAVRPAAMQTPVRSKEVRLRTYEDTYLGDAGFESNLLGARQQLILDLLQRERPRRVVEVGCGADMLARRAREEGLLAEQWVVVEPSRAFAQLARDAATEDASLVVVESFFEDSVPELLAIAGGLVDMVVLSGLLHELESPAVVLHAAREILSSTGLLHVNVPNAFSLHRRLAQAMGLIPDVHHPSERNRELEQFHVFDRESLRATVQDAGFIPEDEGGYFLKPFTHAQMLSIRGLLSPTMLQGLWQLGRALPDLASEIYVNARRRP
jgi:dTDP-4-amino-4,6-dideoxygalactose transaminase/SAM-dependent methyltransferase